jgi:mutual gliding-motility protein MglA
MAELRHKERTIGTKIVYYGPGMSGKTTNIQVLHEYASTSRRGELVSVNTAQDRTIMFDLLPMKVAAFRGLDLKVQLVAVPGQAMYAAIRRLALKDVDAIVFVGNSAPENQEENATSLKELLANLARLPGDAASLPMVLQYNKRDLPGAVPIQVMDKSLNARHVPAMPAVAIRGEGVLETFTTILTLTVTDLARRYKLTDLGRNQSIEDWAAAAVQEIFGAAKFGALPQSATPSTGEVPGRRTVRLSLPADVATAERLDARTNEALVESYAQVATALTEDAQAIREERDLAQRRLADVFDVMDAARMLKPGASRDPVHAVVLGCLAREADAPRASMLVPGLNQTLRASALHHLERDPILAQPKSMARLQNFLQATTPRWYETDDAALHEILAASQPPHGSVISVPLAASPGSPIGIALLYRPPAAPPPRREALKHLADLSRILGPFLESTESSGGEGEAAARELLGTASRVATPRLLNFLRELRQKLADLRRHPDTPAWLTTGLGDVSNVLGDATSVARSLTRFDTGALEAELVDLPAFLGKFAGADVLVDVAGNVPKAKIDPALFGLAVDSLIERARRQGGPVEVRCTAREMRIALRIGVKGTGGASKGGDHGLAFPTRVVELHGGHLTVEAGGSLGSWVLVDLAIG